MLDWNVVVTLHRGGFPRAVSLLRAFGEVEETGLYNVLVLRAPDPRRFLEELRERSLADREVRRVVSHVLPVIKRFSFDSAEEFEEKAGRVTLGWVEELAGMSFHVRMHRRGMKEELASASEERMLDEVILEALERRGTPGQIEFQDPDAVVSVETLRHAAGMALWRREELERYPLLSSTFHLRRRERTGDGAGEAERSADVARARRLLLAERSRLLGRWRDESEEENSLLGERELDWEDLAAEQRDAAILQRLGDAEVAELEEIVAALRRVEEGTYGRCESCGGPISAVRLRALPATRLCIGCAAEREEPAPPPAA